MHVLRTIAYRRVYKSDLANVLIFPCVLFQEIANNLARLSVDALARLGGYLSM